ncbi:LpqB family beta-propeller domain-containing protein [Streptomyces sp. T-3]|nr:LpqB family beta-propeller domain-containing protein [Streptomyces sp. T-3]
MGAERGRRGRSLRTGAVLGCSGLLLAGCASMPDGGGVEPVEASPQEPQVRVFAVPPREGAGPEEIVQGFLEALTSDDPEFSMARKYLTSKASKEWRSDESTTVLADGPTADEKQTSNDPGGNGYRYVMTGQMVGIVSAEHAYRPAAGDAYGEEIHLSKRDGKEWRIDSLPNGVVLGKSDFQRLYQSVNKYYFASRSSSDREDAQPTPLVPDPVYVRRRMDPMTETVKSLLDGPTTWLDQVVASRFPTGTKLKSGTKGLTLDDENRLKVPLNKRSDGANQSQCMGMATQLFFTLQNLTPSVIDQVELQDSQGDSLCVLGADAASANAPHRKAGQPLSQYLVDEKHRLVRLAKNGDAANPVGGPLGDGTRRLRAAAVARDEASAAGVSKDGTSLYVGSILGGEVEKAKVRSRGQGEKDRLTAPSWDNRNDLWVADRDPERPRLLWLAGGEGEPVEVDVEGLGDGRITSLRVSDDGVRVALLVEQDGKTALKIGRLERDGTPEHPEVSVRGLRQGAPQMEDVTAMSWAGGGRLVVVGKEAGGVQQLKYVQSDGSEAVGPALPALTGVTEIAASEDERLPLVAHSEDGIVRLAPGEDWKTVVTKGAAPVYPG